MEMIKECYKKEHSIYAKVKSNFECLLLVAMIAKCTSANPSFEETPFFRSNSIVAAARRNFSERESSLQAQPDNNKNAINEILYFDGKVTEFQLGDNECTFSIGGSQEIDVHKDKLICKFLRKGKENDFKVHLEAQLVRSSSQSSKIIARNVKFSKGRDLSSATIRNCFEEAIMNGQLKDVLVFANNSCYMVFNENTNLEDELILRTVDGIDNCLFLIDAFVKNEFAGRKYMCIGSSEYFYRPTIFK